MKTSCVVTNFNYAPYVGEAIQSALSQTHPFDEIIVVDDASSDGSAGRIQEAFGGKVLLVAKPQNEGQLAAFITGVNLALGDLLFFLDADDLYEPNYLKRALAVHEGARAVHEGAPSPDFVFCAHRLFGATDGLDQPWPRDRDLGCSLLRTYFRRRFIGGPTSTLSMRRSVFEALRPALRPEEWRICADACLIDGSGLIGARKFYIAEPLVRYRVHDANSHHGKRQSRLAEYQHHLRTGRFAGLLLANSGVDMDHLLAAAYREFRTIPEPDFSEFVDYLRLAVARTPLRRNRLDAVLRVVRHYLDGRLGRSDAPPK